MNKEDLITMGLTEEQAAKVMESLDRNYVPKTRFNEVNEENKTLKKTVSDRDKQLEDLEKSNGDNEELKKQIADLKKTNADQVKALEAELKQSKIDSAVNEALTAAGTKNMKAAKALLDLEGVKIGDDGIVIGVKEQVEKLAVAEDSKFLFNIADTKPAFKGFQPGSSTTVPDSTQAGYEARLADARKSNNTLEVIKIKQEAAADGVVLM